MLETISLETIKETVFAIYYSNLKEIYIYGLILYTVRNFKEKNVYYFPECELK